jgi:hypothetical protein
VYAQLIRGGTTPERRAELDRLVGDRLIPALEEEPGFAGALNLVDRETGDAMLVILWDSAEQALRPLGDYGSRFLTAFLNAALISTANHQPPSVWEVNTRV